MDKDRVAGKAKQLEGVTQQKWGEAKDKARDLWKDAKDKADDVVGRGEDHVDEVNEDTTESAKR